jgi:hypothetical protein
MIGIQGRSLGVEQISRLSPRAQARLAGLVEALELTGCFGKTIVVGMVQAATPQRQPGICPGGLTVPNRLGCMS